MIESKHISKELSDVAIGIEKLNKDEFDSRFGNFTPPYLFSTENLRDSFDLFDFNGKDALVTAGSGDHAFEAYRRGARSVDMFDCNIFQKYIIELKHTLIKELDYEKFIEFFFNKQNQLNIQIIKDFVHKLSAPTKMFLNGYYNSPNKLRFFHSRPYWASTEYKMRNVPYIDSETEYNELKSKLPDTMNFVQCDINDLHKIFHKEFDYIHLSNIFIAGTETMTSFYESKVAPMVNRNLSYNNGCLAFCYLWLMNSIAYGNANVRDTFQKVFTSDNQIKYSIQEFAGAQKSSHNDGLLTIHKNGHFR